MNVMGNPRQPWYTKAVDGEVRDVDEKTMTVVSRITTDGLDRDQEVIVSGGVDLDQYARNPIVLFMHDPFQPIGRSMWQKRRDGEILAKTEFSRRRPFAMEIFSLYADGIMNSWSVGLDPFTMVRRECRPEDVKARPDWAGCRRIIEKATLLEYSAVSVPANPEALNRALASGKLTHAKAYIERVRDAAAVGAVPTATKRTVEVVRAAPLTSGEVARMVSETLRRVRGG